MVYTKSKHPRALDNLPQEIKEKAIEILNALVSAEKKMDREYALAISIVRAKEWVKRNETKKKTRSPRVKYYVTPHEKGWTVKSDSESPVEFLYTDKEMAIRTAKSLAKKHHAELVVNKSDGKVDQIISY